jgi:hypothetical protein
MAEKLLEHINETIREQESYETLKNISQNLWIGTGWVFYFFFAFFLLLSLVLTNALDDSRLDLTAPTRHMGPRRLLKQGPLMKAKSGKKLRAFLCSDTLVLLDDAQKNLYRMVRSSLILISHSLTEGPHQYSAYPACSFPGEGIWG